MHCFNFFKSFIRFLALGILTVGLLFSTSAMSQGVACSSLFLPDVLTVTSTTDQYREYGLEVMEASDTQLNQQRLTYRHWEESDAKKPRYSVGVTPSNRGGKYWGEIELSENVVLKLAGTPRPIRGKLWVPTYIQETEEGVKPGIKDPARPNKTNFKNGFFRSQPVHSSLACFQYYTPNRKDANIL